jgi:biopolymer transport protein ExbD
MQLQPEANKPYDDINITPMLDLAYVLLIIFIIMTTAAVQGMKVNLPHASQQQSLAQPQTQAITITSDGRVFLNTVPVSMAELQDRLVAQEAQTPNFPVVVSGDGQAQYQGVMDVLDLLGRLNITQVGLATKPSGAGQ